MGKQCITDISGVANSSFGVLYCRYQYRIGTVTKTMLSNSLSNNDNFPLLPIGQNVPYHLPTQTFLLHLAPEKSCLFNFHFPFFFVLFLPQFSQFNILLLIFPPQIAMAHISPTPPRGVAYFTIYIQYSCFGP